MQKRILTRILYVQGGVLPPSYYKPFGRIVQKFHAALAVCTSLNIGKNASIEENGYVLPDMIAGDNSGVGVSCEICRDLIPDKNVMMRPECSFYSANHKFNPETRRFEGYTDVRPIVVEDDVWIDRRIVITGGVTIDKSVVAGAGSMVVKDVPPYCVATSNPAAVKKKLLNEQELTTEQRGRNHRQETA